MVSATTLVQRCDSRWWHWCTINLSSERKNKGSDSKELSLQHGRRELDVDSMHDVLSVTITETEDDGLKRELVLYHSFIWVRMRIRIKLLMPPLKHVFQSFRSPGLLVRCQPTATFCSRFGRF